MEERAVQVESTLKWERQGELPEWTEMPEQNRRELIAVLAEMLMNGRRKAREASVDE